MDDTEADNRARLTCARLAKGDPEILRDLLSMLALWPGQEKLRRATTLVTPLGGEHKTVQKKRGSR